MRIEMVIHTYVEVFNRLLSFRFDLTDWRTKFKRTQSSIIVAFGPLEVGYTNQNRLQEYLKNMLINIEQDLKDYDAKQSFVNDIEEKPQSNLLN